MEGNSQRNIFENIDISTLHLHQNELSKFNQGVLRGLEAGTFHLITLPSKDQDFIDSSLLNSELLATHIHNGLVVDIMSSPSNTTTSNVAVNQIAGPGNEIIERQFIATDTYQQQHEDEIHNQHDLVGEQERKLAAFIQLVQKSQQQYQQQQQIVSNETQVIVANNKEMATLTPISEGHKNEKILNNFISIDHQRQQETTIIQDSNTMKFYQTATQQNFNINPLPLPPLTPIRRTQHLKQIVTIQNHNVKENNTMKDEIFDVRNIKSDCEDEEIDEGNTESDEKLLSIPITKRNLPHKKRLTKKLKTINKIQLEPQHRPSASLMPEQHRETVIFQDHDSHENNFQQEKNFNTVAVSQIHPQQSQHQLQQQFSCQLCDYLCETQIDFFAHLKSHYEPQLNEENKQEKSNYGKEVQMSAMKCVPIRQLIVDNIIGTVASELDSISAEDDDSVNDDLTTIGGSRESMQTIVQTNLAKVNSCSNGNQNNNKSITDNVIDNDNDKLQMEEEFSDTEDMLEGIRGVVEKVQESVGIDSPEVLDIGDWYENDDFHETIDFKNTVVQSLETHDSSALSNLNGVGVGENLVLYINKSDLQKHVGPSSVIFHQSTNQSVHQTHKLELCHEPLSVETGIISDEQHEISVLPRTIIETSAISIKTVPSSTEESSFPSITINSTSAILAKSSGKGRRKKTLSNKKKDKKSIRKISKADQKIRKEIAKLIAIPSQQSQEQQFPEHCDTTKPIIVPIVNDTDNSNGLENSNDNKIDDVISDTDIDCDNDVGSKRSTQKKKIKCLDCNRGFNSKNALQYHILSHTGERPHQCEICGKSFYASSALKVHMRLHSGAKPYTCSFCQRQFRQWGDLKYHVTSIHSDEKNHQCEFCGKDFARRYSLVIHRRIHTGEKNYNCDFCEKSFRASSYLQNHRKIHTGEKPHSCPVCNKKFRVRGDMKRHLKTHSREKVSRKNLSANKNHTENRVSDASTSDVKVELIDEKPFLSTASELEKDDQLQTDSSYTNVMENSSASSADMTSSTNILESSMSPNQSENKKKGLVLHPNTSTSSRPTKSTTLTTTELMTKIKTENGAFNFQIGNSVIDATKLLRTNNLLETSSNLKNVEGSTPALSSSPSSSSSTLSTPNAQVSPKIQKTLAQATNASSSNSSDNDSSSNAASSGPTIAVDLTKMFQTTNGDNGQLFVWPIMSYMS